MPTKILSPVWGVPEGTGKDANSCNASTWTAGREVANSGAPCVISKMPATISSLDKASTSTVVMRISYSVFATATVSSTKGVITESARAYTAVEQTAGGTSAKHSAYMRRRPGGVSV